MANYFPLFEVSFRAYLLVPVVGLLYKKGLCCVHQFLIGVVGLVIGVRESLMGRLGALHLRLFRLRLKNRVRLRFY